MSPYALVSYPVSALLWCWHALLGTVLGPGAAWSLAVVLLVVTLRVLLLPLTLAQLRAGRRMAALQPEIARLREKHDRQTFAVELQKLHREHGVNPLGGLLPALAQLPVFLGLFHVLHGFAAGGRNYVFGPADVTSFNQARFLGAPLAGWIRMPATQLAAYGVDRWQVAAVALLLAALAALATYLTTSQAPRLLRHLFPAGAVLGAPFFPVAVLLYWLTNNVCTLVHQKAAQQKGQAT